MLAIQRMSTASVVDALYLFFRGQSTTINNNNLKMSGCHSQT